MKKWMVYIILGLSVIIVNMLFSIIVTNAMIG